MCCLILRRFQRNSGRFSKGHQDSVADAHSIQTGGISHPRSTLVFGGSASDASQLATKTTRIRPGQLASIINSGMAQPPQQLGHAAVCV